ncbi:MAG: hypothetical protein WAM78_22110 [Candidatus Sulfotelmatobacter sp.]
MGSPSLDPNANRQSPARNNPTPLDAIFILFASVALVVLILSFSPVRGAQPFQNLPGWLISAVSNFWSRLFVGAGTLGTLGLRKWLDRNPAPNYLVWIPVFTVGLLAAVLFSTAIIIPPPPVLLNGSIDAPKAGQTVSRRTFECSGKVSGVGTDMHLWLAVEVNNHIWPKEREIHMLADGSWKTVVYEDGATDKFSLSLLSANAEAEKQINQWIEAGKKTGQYTDLVGIPGTERLDRIDGLRLKSN